MAGLKILLLLVVCVTVVMCETMSMTLTLDNQEEILDWHNEQRRIVNPPATNMLRLAWSDELALLAENSSLACPPNGTQALPEHSSLGSVTQSALTFTMTELDEAGFMYGQLLRTYWLDLAVWPEPCPGGDCEPYLQVVWADTQYLGCEVNNMCSEDTVVIVCNYSPGADIEPYLVGGARCSQCPSHAPLCENETLCYASDEITTAPITLPTTTPVLTPTALVSTPTTTPPIPAPTPSAPATAQMPSPSVEPNQVLIIIETVTQIIELDSLCPSDTRLANVYVILIGVIPSTIAIALFFILFIVVCSNRRRKNKARRRINVQPPNQPASPRRGILRAPAPTTGQDASAQLLRQLSPPQATCASPTSGEALLPNPPSPKFEDRTGPSRGSTFATPSFLDSSFSYSASYSEPTASNDVYSEGLPVVGLTSINEEREEGAGQVGVANIIAKLERGKGRRRMLQAITTES